MTTNQHVTLAGRLWIIYSALILVGGLAATFYFLGATRQETVAGEFLFLALFALPGFAGGIALLRRRAWARVLLLVLGFLNLVSFPPVGAVLGGYTIWLLFNKQKTIGILND